MTYNPNRNNPKARTAKDIFNLVRAKQHGAENIEGVLPQGEVQMALAGLWNEVLHAGNYGTNNDFFTVGGNSIKAVQLASKIARHFSLQIELTDIFLNTTVATQERLVQDRKQQPKPENIIKVHDRLLKIPLSSSQERLWIIDKLEGSIQYHIPLVF